jgi:hypothetical protein
MAVGLLTLPVIYILSLFAGGDASVVKHLLILAILLFYVQLVVQSIVATVLLKRIKYLNQYLASILLILMSPLILLPVGLSIGGKLESEPILQSVLLGTLSLQVIGSLWMWVIIVIANLRPTKAAEDRSKAEPQNSSALDQPTAASQGPISTTTPVVVQSAPASVSWKSKKKLGIAILLVPVVLFIISLIFAMITAKIDPGYFTVHAASIPGQAFDATATLSGMLFVPCVIVGVILLAKK